MSEVLRQPRLVVFDLDGTLQDTYLWWPAVLREGLRAFAAATGLALREPGDDEANAVIGLADEGVWAPWLPAEHRERWRDLRRTVLPREADVVRSGRDFLYPGVRPLLRHLRSLGVRTAIASNCRGVYLQAVLEGQGLGALTDWHFCLDSPGVAVKADMVRLALEAAGTRRAVMVGDRENDMAAARANALPFVWRRNGRGEVRGADALWDGAPAHLLSILGLPGIT
ncbi:MAG: HAD family hydrolase [Planctomycetes bacterium]|nr:HAD family hydrolase [Planctomycetota bacterium]